MANVAWVVAYDLQPAASGYGGVKPETKIEVGQASSEAETLPNEELSKGLTSTVYSCKLVVLNAESAEGATKAVARLYGNNGGVAIAAKKSNMTVTTNG